MNKLKLALRGVNLSIIVMSLVVLLSVPAVVVGLDWPEQRCREIQGGLEGLEKRAPQLREEIAKREEELEWLQAFQKGSQAVYLSYAVNHVPLVLAAIIGKLPMITPLEAQEAVKSLGNFQSYVNQREIRVRLTEFPRLRDEQTEVGRQIFLLRDESESLKCPVAVKGNNLLQQIVGEWKIAETDHFVRIEAGGRGILLETMENPFGFEEGETVLTEFRDAGNVIEAELVIHASKEDCPSLAPITTGATIRVQPDGKTFILTAPNFTYCTKTCQWTREQSGTLTRTFNRVEVQ